MRVDQMVHSE
ncbi:hypothetical protein RDI58_010660 [Solanum bulbocastanum]|uniref:Uncharacterized protein n=1 Tax=Solanum bulbocastanum TaxID=147425 RepID=A0AAN8TPU9_SOLBU